MTVTSTPTPDTVLAKGDPGDDTARRFRYQWTYAAITCCALLDGNEDIDEVFCEHHEDILIKHLSGKFSGLQVKTRQADQNSWKATDEAVVNSCCRFVDLDAGFPDLFSSFKFLTNHPLSGAKNGRGLPYLLNLIKDAESPRDLDDHATKFVAKIAAKSRHSTDESFAALKKTVASDSLPKLADIQSRLVDTLASVWDQGGNSTNQALHRAAQNLVTECQNASSLGHEQLLPAYLPGTADAISVEIQARIDGKRLDRTRVIASLEFGLHSSAILEGDIDACPMPGVGESDVLLRKLDAGGFSVVSRNSAIDLRNKADVLGLKWLGKHGRKDGLKQYDHIRSCVLSDAAKSFEKTKKSEESFGLEMLDELRAQFKLRRNNRDQLFDSRDEHLEGFAYGLTAECKIQWSLEFTLEVI